MRTALVRAPGYESVVICANSAARTDRTRDHKNETHRCSSLIAVYLASDQAAGCGWKHVWVDIGVVLKRDQYLARPPPPCYCTRPPSGIKENEASVKCEIRP